MECKNSGKGEQLGFSFLSKKMNNIIPADRSNNKIVYINDLRATYHDKKRQEKDDILLRKLIDYANQLDW